MGPDSAPVSLIQVVLRSGEMAMPFDWRKVSSTRWTEPVVAVKR